MYIRQEIEDKISTYLNNALIDAVEDDDIKMNVDDLPIAELETPREKERGEFATTIALQLPKLAHDSPQNIAKAIVKHFETHDLPIENIEIAGPGFINFKLKPNWNNEVVTQVLELKDNYGRSDINKGKTFNVEFVSANPTGPMHIGNARGGAIGDVLSSVADWTGYDVTREFYVNNAGNQINKLQDSLEARYQQILGNDVEFPADGYQGEYIKDKVLEFLSQLSEEEQAEIEAMPEADRKNILANYAVRANTEQMRSDLEDYGITYDVWFPESDLYEKGSINEVIDILNRSGKTYQKDGALWFKTTDYGLDKDDVLVRANGVPTYYLGDIAYHINKFQTRDFDMGVNVWGADHYGHVARLKAALEAAGIEKERLNIVLMQLVKLMQDGKEVTMSKRTGKMITLSDLIDDIGKDAARFFFNLRSPESHLVFDLDLAIEESNNNPVFYVQYAHARIASILRRLVIKDDEHLNFDADLLVEPEERELINVLARFPEEIIIANNTSDPSRLTKYAQELASSFHTFYNACRVDIKDKELKKSRIALIKATKQVLENVSNILGIESPEKM